MSNLRDIPETNDLVRVGQTLYGEPICAFYPKSMCQTRPKPGGGYEVYVPKHLNRDHRCQIGDFEVRISNGFAPLPRNL